MEAVKLFWALAFAAWIAAMLACEIFLFRRAK